MCFVVDPHTFTEADELFSFTKPLPKKAEGYLKKDFELECVLSSHKAIVSWYKGETKIEVKKQSLIPYLNQSKLSALVPNSSRSLVMSTT